MKKKQTCWSLNVHILLRINLISSIIPTVLQICGAGGGSPQLGGAGGNDRSLGHFLFLSLQNSPYRATPGQGRGDSFYLSLNCAGGSAILTACDGCCFSGWTCGPLLVLPAFKGHLCYWRWAGGMAVCILECPSSWRGTALLYSQIYPAPHQPFPPPFSTHSLGFPLSNIFLRDLLAFQSPLIEVLTKQAGKMYVERPNKTMGYRVLHHSLFITYSPLPHLGVCRKDLQVDSISSCPAVAT